MNKKILAVIAILSVSLAAFADSLKDSRKDGHIIESKYGAVVYHNTTGGVTFYAKGRHSKFIPIVSIADNSDGTCPTLSIDGVNYNLLTSTRVKSQCVIENDVMTVTYTINKKHKMAIRYEFTDNVNEGDNLRITYSVLNETDRMHEYEFKYVFDTILGEAKNAHFNTAYKQVNSETVVTAFDKHKFVLSNDETAGVKFILDDSVAKKLIKVVMANHSYFETNMYEGFFQEGRSLNAVLCYNDTCVGFWFKPFDVGVNRTKSFSQNLNLFVNNIDGVSFYDTPKKVKSDDSDSKQAVEKMLDDDEEEPRPSRHEKKAEQKKAEPVLKADYSAQKPEENAEPKPVVNPTVQPVEQKKNSVTKVEEKKAEPVKPVKEEPVKAAAPAKPVETVKPAETVKAAEPVKETVKPAEQKTEAPQPKAPEQEEKIEVPVIPESNINYEYAKELIRRISELDPKTAKRSDIAKLQVELDELMRLLNERAAQKKGTK
ncbi:MAG: hypothetical protein MJ169_06790 [Treponema sp.]|nr:hypothetical protein [Treponema sp.]